MKKWLLIVMMFQCFDIAAQQKTRVLILLDGSFSMRKTWTGGSKWAVACNSIYQIADSFSRIENVELGIRVFGHQFNESEKNCKDTRLEVPIGKINRELIERKLNGIFPKGITPIAYSLDKATSDFGTDLNTKNIIILITDGEEACEGDPCAISQKLQYSGIVLKPFIIGLALPAASQDKFLCAGEFYNASTAAEFQSTLSQVAGDAVAKTTLQVSLNDINGKPTESDVAMTFVESKTQISKYHFVHSLNARGMPDTISISPVIVYDLIVHTIPPVRKEGIALKRFVHNTVEVSVPQGSIELQLQGVVSKSDLHDRLKCLIRKKDEGKTLNVQRMNSTEKYLCGKYDLEVLTLPRQIIRDVDVSQSKTTTIKIPAPGILTLNKTYEVYGGIFVIEKNRMKKIYEIKADNKQEVVALQPGKYRVVYRAKNSRTAHTTVDKEIEIVQGGSLALKL